MIHKVLITKKYKKSFFSDAFNKIINNLKTIKIEKFIFKRISYIVTDTTENDYEVIKILPKA